VIENRPGGQNVIGAQAKSQPGRISIATEGPKTFSGMLADSFAASVGIKLNHVPYTKSADAVQDVLGGRVNLICLPEAALISYIRSGQMRALAVSSAQRLAALLNVPAVSEVVTGFEFTGWNGVFAPAGTSDEIISRVNRDRAALLRQAEIAQRQSHWAP
jgi:tripartite-type tricarboxylate transporter receptor subunit TctC